MSWSRSSRKGVANGQSSVKPPFYQTHDHILANPVYAGSYAYGPRATRVMIKDGRKRVTRDRLRRSSRDWDVNWPGRSRGSCSNG